MMTELVAAHLCLPLSGGDRDIPLNHVEIIKQSLKNNLRTLTDKFSV